MRKELHRPSVVGFT